MCPYRVYVDKQWPRDCSSRSDFMQAGENLTSEQNLNQGGPSVLKELSKRYQFPIKTGIV